MAGALSRRLCCAALIAAPAFGAATRPRVPLVLTTDISLPYGKGIMRMLKLIGDHAQLEFRVESVPLARALRMAERGEALIWGISHSPERARQLLFSEPVHENHVWMITRKGALDAFSGYEALRGRRVCLRRGEQYDPVFEAARERDFDVAQVDGDLLNRLRMVQGGRCDLTLISRRYSRHALLGFLRGLGDTAEGLDVLTHPLLNEGVHMAVAHGTALAAHLPAINRAIKAQAKAIQALIDADG